MAIRFMPTKKTKFNNRKVHIDGMNFASKREAQRYGELKLLQTIGEISELETQPRFSLVVNGERVCSYVADFAYKKGDLYVVEDVKSAPTKTPIYRLKKKLMRAVWGIDITEIE